MIQIGLLFYLEYFNFTFIFRIGSFTIPVLEHHQTQRHHVTGIIK